MTIPFYKYQGTGNDFVMIDNRTGFFPKDNTTLVALLCDRKFGVGADGLILLENHKEVDFTMVYYNADGNLSSMCGNGGRCIVAFAKMLALINNEATFEAVDGIHSAFVKEDIVHLKMQNVGEIKKTDDYTFIDTGSPHHVQFVNDLGNLDVKDKGAAIRFSDLYSAPGANINFIERESKNVYRVRTYERGVEDETLSCGTGVTAVALALHHNGHIQTNHAQLQVEGGELRVSFEKTDSGYHNIFLIGPAQEVFKGEWVC